MHIQDTYPTQQTITQHNRHPVGIEKMLVLIMDLQAHSEMSLTLPAEMKLWVYFLRFLRLGKEQALKTYSFKNSLTSCLSLYGRQYYSISLCRKSLRSGPRSGTMQNIIVMTICLFNTQRKNNKNISFKPLAKLRKVNTTAILYSSR